MLPLPLIKTAGASDNMQNAQIQKATVSDDTTRLSVYRENLLNPHTICKQCLNVSTGYFHMWKFIIIQLALVLRWISVFSLQLQ